MDEVIVRLDYKDTSVEFRGEPVAVLESLHRFLLKIIPNLELADKITLDYSLPELIDTFSDYIRLTPEGPIVIASDKIPDRNYIALYLLAYRIARLANKVDDDKLSLQELQRVTNLKPKTISSRVSELARMRCVERFSNDGVRYRITTYGIHWLSLELNKQNKRLR